MLGEGIVKGLTETARNFFGSYVSKDRLTTVQYPEVHLPQAEAAREFPILIFDGPRVPDADGAGAASELPGLRCVACLICEVECPPKCITIEKSKDKKPDATGRMQFYPETFNIDVSICMSCQICVEVCPFDAIKMDNKFELATGDRFGGLLWDRARLAKSNDYYHEVHPSEAAAVDEALAAERAKAKAAANARAAAAAAKAAGAAPGAAQ